MEMPKPISTRVRRRLAIDGAAQNFVIMVTVAAGTFEGLTTVGQIVKGESLATWASTAAIAFLLFIIGCYATSVKRSNSLQLQLMGILDVYEVQIRQLGQVVAQMAVAKSRAGEEPHKTEKESR